MKGRQTLAQDRELTTTVTCVWFSVGRHLSDTEDWQFLKKERQMAGEEVGDEGTTKLEGWGGVGDEETTVRNSY